MPQSTILWPTDLSKGSMKAREQVTSLAEKLDAKVVVMYVSVDLCSYFPAYGNFPSPERLQEFQSWEMEEARRSLSKICDSMRGCPNLKVRLVRGDAAEEILKAIREEDASLVIMSSRGSSIDVDPARGTGLGSVARKVLEGSTVPVQVVYP